MSSTISRGRGTISRLDVVYKTIIVKMGAFHTIELEKHRAFTLHKDEWDVITLDRIEESTNVAIHAEIAALVPEEGIANLCFITESLTVFEKGVTRFYDVVADAIMRHIDFEVTKIVILAAPGFTRMSEHLKAVLSILTAAEANAETRTVTDGLFRLIGGSGSRERKFLVERVKDTGGKVLMFSTMHISGEQLSQLSGVAAILHFPMQELDEEELEDDIVPSELDEPPGSVDGDV
ncbi:hypothetical protein BJ742DRAFT_780441 [Cladochytrium replicatum]|nr:hypothetical protein BJ742DRAFT_780441 [Cladochytrium replicatum]